jgi:hypothetical protein
MQLDVFVPELHLAFEYQGEQHYFNIFSYGAQWGYEKRDAEKRRACKAAGITLIEVPYWWDFAAESLAATIHQHRPELITSSTSAQPIPTQPPEGFPIPSAAIKKKEQPSVNFSYKKVLCKIVLLC